MTKRSKVLLLIPHCGGGGAETVIALLAKGLSRQKYEVHLGLVTENVVPGISFPAGVSLHLLGARRVRSAGLRLIALIRNLRPRVILSGMFHLNFLVLLLRPFFPRPVRVLIRQNGTVSSALAFDKRSSPTRVLYRTLYRWADAVICQSDAMKRDLELELGLDGKRLAVLQNPIDVEGIRQSAAGGAKAWTGAGPHLLAVGRLSWEKGFDLLLEALQVVRERFPEADLVVAGSGREEAALKSLRGRLGLEDCVRFAGCVEEPAMLFPGATVYVLSSRHEGMPNALLEAAAAGLPLVATPASGGIVDLLKGQPGAWVAADIASPSLAASLLEALESLRIDERFTHAFLEPFRMDRAIAKYEALIDRALEEMAQPRTAFK